MHELTRTVAQWIATMRRLEVAVPYLRIYKLTTRIRQTVGSNPFTHPQPAVALLVSAEELAEIERVAPITAP